MSCRTGCPTKTCGTYAACLKGMGLQIGDLGRGVAAATDRRLNAYADARRQGLQPQSTQLAHSQLALRYPDAHAE
jgi:hypothetical protein